MRQYNCYYYYYQGEVFKTCGNQACWSYIQSTLAQKVTEIYIDKYEEPETKEYIDLLVRVVNKITPCSIEEIKDKKYIKLKLLDTYDRCLIILNFIRYLWNITKGGYNDNMGELAKTFFEELKKSTFKDGLKRLTSANKKMCEKHNIQSVGNHSNVHEHDKLKIKSTEELLTSNYLTKQYDMAATRNFLIN